MRDAIGTKLVVVGQGYVGLPVAVEAARAGFGVIGYDIDSHKAHGLRHGRSHVEDITDAELQAVISSGNYVATSNTDDLRGFDVAVISVPTPLRNERPDMGYICLLYTSPSPRDQRVSRMPSSA